MIEKPADAGSSTEVVQCFALIEFADTVRGLHVGCSSTAERRTLLFRRGRRWPALHRGAAALMVLGSFLAPPAQATGLVLLGVHGLQWHFEVRAAGRMPRRCSAGLKLWCSAGLFRM